MTRVNFKIAKLLKEKQFGDIPKSYTSEGELVTVSLAIRRYNHYKIYYPAPTITKVVMWIYKKHKIWISVDINILSKWHYTLSNLKDKRNAEIYTGLKDYFNSPTEAYLSAIEYVLIKKI